MRQNLIALASGTLFGAGLAVSGMVDPARVRAFLDVTGRWDPTLAFVMCGAILPMAAAWALTRTRATPFLAEAYQTPPTLPIDASLIIGALLFGVGWGLVGLCPGPAIATLVLKPESAAVFVATMAVGAGAHSLIRSAFRPRRSVEKASQ